MHSNLWRWVVQAGEESAYDGSLCVPGIERDQVPRLIDGGDRASGVCAELLLDEGDCLAGSDVAQSDAGRSLDSCVCTEPEPDDRTDEDQQMCLFHSLLSFDFLFVAYPMC